MKILPTQVTDSFDGKTVTARYYEDHGKDPGAETRVGLWNPNANWYEKINRWRVSFYYDTHLAITKLFHSEEDKNKFLNSLPRDPASTGDSLKDYDIWRQSRNN